MLIILESFIRSRTLSRSTTNIMKGYHKQTKRNGTHGNTDRCACIHILLFLLVVSVIIVSFDWKWNNSNIKPRQNMGKPILIAGSGVNICESNRVAGRETYQEGTGWKICQGNGLVVDASVWCWFYLMLKFPSGIQECVIMFYSSCDWKKSQENIYHHIYT